MYQGFKGGIFLSYAVVHMKKLSAPNVKGVQFHHQRERESNTNPDIDYSKSELNYDLVNCKNINFNTEVNKVIKENVITNKAIRKDAVVLTDFVITSDKEFFKGLNDEEQKRFFEKSCEFFKSKYGENKVIYARVHLDETTPHMHLGLVPITEDGKLSAKTLFNRQGLSSIQDDYPKYMQEHGFDLQRGEPKDNAKRLETQEYKRQQAKELSKELDKSINTLKSDLKHITAFDDVKLDKVPLPFMKGKIAVSKSQYEDNIKMGTLGKVTLNENEKLKRHIETLEEIKSHEINRAVQDTRNEYREMLENKEKEIQKLKTENEKLKKDNEFYYSRNREISTKLVKLTKENKGLSNEVKIRNKALDRTISKMSEQSQQSFKNALDKQVKSIIKSLDHGLER